MEPQDIRGRTASGLSGRDVRLVDEYLFYIRFVLNLSKATINAYEGDLTRFLGWARSNGRVGVRGVRRQHILDFQAHRADDQAVSARTRARELSSIRSFYRHLVETGVVEDNPAQLVDSVKLPFKLPRVLREDEVAHLVESPSPDTSEGLRDRAILEFMYATGVRVSELCNLSLTNLRIPERSVTVDGKGGKQRVVPLTHSACDSLDSYLKQARGALLRSATRVHPEARTRVFVSRRGKGLTRQAVWKLIRKYSLQVGLSADVHPHMLRHCFATHLLVHGADLRVVQMLLGHGSIATTEIYTHLDRTALQRSYDRCHPRS